MRPHIGGAPSVRKSTNGVPDGSTTATASGAQSRTRPCARTSSASRRAVEIEHANLFHLIGMIALIQNLSPCGR
jgi:hypothetical protein